MLRSLAKLAPALRLTRITTTFAAVANIWFVILWTRATVQEPGYSTLTDGPLWLELLGGAMVAVGLYSFAAAGNDVLDIRRDRALHPHRPLASGALSSEAAVALITLSLIGSILGASLLGLWAVRICLLTTTAILFYNVVGRHFPSARVVLLGLIYATHMLIPNPGLIFIWPVWLAMTHALCVSAITHRLAGARPVLTSASITAATIGWLFWSGVLFGVGWMRSGALWPVWVSPAGGILAGALATLFAVSVWRIVTHSPDRLGADRVMRLGAFWLALYGGAWLFGQGHVREGAAITLVAVAGFAGAVALRELYARLEQPLDYRL